MKPTNLVTRSRLPFRSKSTYNRSYTEPGQNEDDYEYIKDQLKTGQNWYGFATTYSGVYEQPNPEYFPKRVTQIEKKDNGPAYSGQYRKDHYI